MKYRVYVKEIWEQPYIVEANSKAHAKTLIEKSNGRLTTAIQKDATPPHKWGTIGSEKWEVEEL
ncbi:hypothetical protein WDW89_06120 [Deltaproteobacteria bacterium TL4]